jgi:hypothetical protein
MEISHAFGGADVGRTKGGRVGLLFGYDLNQIDATIILVFGSSRCGRKGRFGKALS